MKKKFMLFLLLLLFIVPVVKINAEVCYYYIVHSSSGNWMNPTVKLQFDSQNNQIKLINKTYEQDSIEDSHFKRFDDKIKNYQKNADGYESINACPDYLTVERANNDIWGGKFQIYGSNTTYKKDPRKKIAEIFVYKKDVVNTYCDYSKYYLNINTTEKKISAYSKEDTSYLSASGQYVTQKIEYKIAPEFEQWWFENNSDNKCLNLDVFECEGSELYSWVPGKYIFTDSFLASLSKANIDIAKGCGYNPTKGNDNELIDIGCYFYNTSMSDIQNLYDNYEKATGLEKVNYLNEFNFKLTTLKTTCRNIISSLNYDEKCLNSCLGLQDELESKFDQKYESNPQCGLSGKIIQWIANIIKWAKYLVPVAVIVLGIIDFIKAIASEKEDEMKKAQKKFIIRLISAALIFIVPFVIEFVLNKMGFDANGCGIIDL